MVNCVCIRECFQHTFTRLLSMEAVAGIAPENAATVRHDSTCVIVFDKVNTMLRVHDVNANRFT